MLASACGIDPGGLDSTGAERKETEDRQSSQAVRLSWRDPAIPPDLTPVLSTPSDGDKEKDADAETTPAADGPEVGGSSEQERCWLLSTSPGIPLRLLTAMDFSSDKADFERQIVEVPFQVLQNVARHKEHGEVQPGRLGCSGMQRRRHRRNLPLVSTFRH